ncbi:MAG TPA: carboxypeptidase-like regulatory domain-containing protein [Candidatus Polarisedimenticolaceae bacterium]|nr:carboxypeptidase-like regulatory domain-containing protein [Candidatus Polarisedimenticolaceae bacterium]
MLPALLLLGAAAVSAPPTTASGRVTDPDGSPIAGAQVCVVSDGTSRDCVRTAADGGYRIDVPRGLKVFVRASGFVGSEVEAGPRATPLALKRAAALLVRVVDAQTREPLSSGKVLIYAPSGRRFGEAVPFNRAGVRVSTLEPGQVLVRAEASGFDPGGPFPVDLVGGREESLTIPMKKSGKPPR